MHSVRDTAARAAIAVIAVLGLSCARPADAAEAEGRLEAVELPAGAGGGASLDIAVRRDARCNFGDLDAISLDMGILGDDGGLQLTAEVLGGESDQIYYADSAGGGWSLRLPHFARPTVLGLFLCSASKTGPRVPCSQQRLQDYRGRCGPHTLDMTRAGSDGRNFGSVPARAVSPETVKDRIYFFRFAILQGDRLEFPGRAMNDERYDSLIAELQQRNADVVSPAALRETLQRYGSTLGSEPLTRQGRGIAFTLPHYDAKKCVGQR